MFTKLIPVLIANNNSGIYGPTNQKTRPVADGWAGPDMRVFPLFDSC